MYIIDQAKQLSLISEMKQLRKNSTSYEVYYHHPFTNQMWKSFFPKANGDNLGPKLLRHEPMPAKIEERLNICLNENEPENAIGLGIECSAKPSLWIPIIQALEKNYSQYDRKQLKLFLKHLDIDESREVYSESDAGDSIDTISSDEINKLIWRSRKVRMKRFFVLG
ncbi:MAG TPA: hypothetical protein VF181_02315 [Balneolaceae bacterium]